jgi:predicted amino acid dehydrogenase
MMHARRRWYGPDSFESWKLDRIARNLAPVLDVVLLTHPRDERDIPMLYPFTQELSVADRRSFAQALQPVCGEIIETPELAVGLMFIARFADEMMDPRTRGDIRAFLQSAGVAAVAATGARVVCLGGLLGALSGYGKRLGGFVNVNANANAHAVTVTTGHSMTSVTVLRTYRRAVTELGLDPRRSRMAVLGAGSVGAAFGRLLTLEQPARRPGQVVLIDKPERARRLDALAAELASAGIDTRIEVTDRHGQLSAATACYDAGFLISAVSTPDVIDIERVAPRTVLVDDSQPNCWSREAAWRRVVRDADIAPCEAGLVDASSINYWSYFPFQFAATDPDAGTPVAWCCLAEGLVIGLDPTMPPTVGEPDLMGLARYMTAFDRFGLQVAELQCGSHFLPVERLRAEFNRKPQTVERVFARTAPPERALAGVGR